MPMSNQVPVSVMPTGSPSLTDARPPASSLSLADIVSEIHEQAVPDFASQALDRLQGSLYASLKYLQLCEPAQMKTLPHTWVGYRSGEIVGVLLFRIQHRRARVLCEVITLDPAQIDAFAASVFRHFPGVHQLVFNAISLQSPPCSLPNQCYAYSENYVLTLPASNEAYIAALGKSTRSSVRGYRNRLQRDFPDFEWTAHHCDALSTKLQRDLVLTLQQFKRESMIARGKSPAIDPVETERILSMGAACGLFGVGRIEGRICAGALSCRIGDTYVMLLSASDPKLSAYRLGLLTCLWSVGDCIARGARDCHLLWGRYAYKHQLLAVPQVLHRMTIYPSVPLMLQQPVTVFLMCARRQYVRGEQWLRYQVAVKKNPVLGWLARQCRYMKSRLLVIGKSHRWRRSRHVDVNTAGTTMVTTDREVVGTAE